MGLVERGSGAAHVPVQLDGDLAGHVEVVSRYPGGAKRAAVVLKLLDPRRLEGREIGATPAEDPLKPGLLNLSPGLVGRRSQSRATSREI
jgi:hypothetical protein